MNPVPPLASVASPEAKTTQDTRLDDLLQRYGAFLRRIIVRVCPAELRLSCDDIEQEARISLWKVLGSEREISFPASYIYKVAVSATRRAIQRARARREEPLEQEGDDADVPRHMPQTPRHASPDNVAERREWIGKIEIALAQLPENRRLTVELHLQDLTTREIGDILGWSEPKARNLLYRGLKDLRKSLRAVGIEYQP